MEDVYNSSDWIPVNKELPTDEEGVVLIKFLNPFFGKMFTEYGSGIYDGDGKWYSPLTGGALIDILIHNVTHWKKFPK